MVWFVLLFSACGPDEAAEEEWLAGMVSTEREYAQLLENWDESALEQVRVRELLITLTSRPTQDQLLRLFADDATLKETSSKKEFYEWEVAAGLVSPECLRGAARLAALTPVVTVQTVTPGESRCLVSLRVLQGRGQGPMLPLPIASRPVPRAGRVRMQPLVFDDSGWCFLACQKRRKAIQAAFERMEALGYQLGEVHELRRERRMLQAIRAARARATSLLSESLLRQLAAMPDAHITHVASHDRRASVEGSSLDCASLSGPWTCVREPGGSLRLAPE